jgi:ribosome-associated protein
MNDEGFLFVGPKLRIPLTEIAFTYAKSGGPGGQNVNKLNTKAVLRWKIADNPAIPDDVRERFLANFRSYVTTEGEVVIASQSSRSALQNTEDCLERLQKMLAAALKAPKIRRPTKPTHGSKIRRREDKTRQSQKKRGRQSPGVEE